MYTRQSIKNFIEIYKDDSIKQNTKNNYVSKIFNYMKKNNNVNIDDQKDIIKNIKMNFESYNINSLMTIISSLVVFLQSIQKKYNLLLDYLFYVQKLKKKNY